MNSAPTKKLQNTCGGISKMQTFTTPVQILVQRDDGDGEGEHLELVFGGEADKSIGEERGTIKANRAYGRLPFSALDQERSWQCDA